MLSHTINTTRIPGSNPVEFGINLCHFVYPTQRVPWRPNVAILTPEDDPFPAVIASSLMHHPLNGPMLITPRDHVAPAVAAELHRLRLPGFRHGDESHLLHVLMVGRFERAAIQAVQELGYTVAALTEPDPVRLAIAVAHLRRQIVEEMGEHIQDVCVVSRQESHLAMAVPAFAAHAGVPILLSEIGQVPSEVKTLLGELGAPRVHVIGSDSADVQRLVSEFTAITGGAVARVGGSDGVETSIALAQYQSPDGAFGWGRNQPGGHAFAFAPVDRWYTAILGGLLGHLGKHAPVLIVPEGTGLPTSLRRYLRSVRPAPMQPPGPPFMHGFLLADPDQGISMAMQWAIEEELTPAHENPAHPMP